MKKNIRAFLDRNRWLKAVPNSLTLCNSLCGFAAIINTLRVYERMYIREGSADAAEILAQSALLILFAMIFDALDGFAARILNAASMHGIQMDSLADMVTFGVAPATLIVVMTHSLPNFNEDNFYIVWLDKVTKLLDLTPAKTGSGGKQLFDAVGNMLGKAGRMLKERYKPEK